MVVWWFAISLQIENRLLIMAEQSLRTMMNHLLSQQQHKFFTFPINYTGESNSYERQNFVFPISLSVTFLYLFLFILYIIRSIVVVPFLYAFLYMCMVFSIYYTIHAYMWHCITLTFVLSVCWCFGPAANLRMRYCDCRWENYNGNHVKIHRIFSSSLQSFSSFAKLWDCFSFYVFY